METTNKYINLDEAQSETVKLNTQAGELETAIKETHYILHNTLQKDLRNVYGVVLPSQRKLSKQIFEVKRYVFF